MRVRTDGCAADEIERSEGQEGQPNADYVPTGATLQSVGADQLREIDFDDGLISYLDG